MGVSEVVDTWGSTAEERDAAYPVDALVEDRAHVLFRAIDIDAPVATTFRWLCQLRAAPYSYDWVDNFGRRSPRQLTPGLERLEAGQRVMSIFQIVGFEPGRSITMTSDTAMFGRWAATYVVATAGAKRSRIVVKLAFTAPRGLYGRLLRRVLPAVDLVMIRKQLRTLRSLAERDAGAHSSMR